jgi:hypothetical protein
MSNPEKHWSWGSTMGKATGAAVAAGGVGAAMGALGGPVGPIVGGAISFAGGFVSGFLGAALGHWWDIPSDERALFGSSALYTTVVCGLLSVILNFFALGHLSIRPEFAARGLFAISALSGFFGAVSLSLIDDWRASAERRKAERKAEFK